jgi:tetraacyldisaccharide 4'-kinase
MRTPEIWQRRDFGSRLTLAALSPLGWVYSSVVAWKAKHAVPIHAGVPVICVGNLTVGGTGKTPVAIAVAQALAELGKKPFFLTRGYGGKLKGPIRVAPEHRAADVGDEPLLLAGAFPTVVARERNAGAKLATELGADVIVMDDGHQNFALHKDLSLVVVDAEQGFGNGLILPAGPLRERIGQGLARADAVIMVGDGEIDLRGFVGTVLRAHIRHADMPDIGNARVVAFAGIGRPDKFFRSLKACGVEIVAERRFADHHVYTPSEIARLKSLARTQNALLITTAKDYVRLSDIGRAGIAVLPVEAQFEDPGRLDALLVEMR